MLGTFVRRIDFRLLSVAARYRLAWAVFLSLLLHLLFLMRFGAFSSPSAPLVPAPLMVKLLGPTASPAVTTRRVEEATLADHNPVSEAKSAAAVREMPLLAPRITPGNDKPLDAQQRRQEPKSRAANEASVGKSDDSQPVVTALEAPTASKPLEKSRQADSSPGLPLPGVTIPVRRAEIEFSLFSGEKGESTGSVRHSFRSSLTETGEYYTLDIAQGTDQVGASSSPDVQLNVGGRILGDELIARRYSLKGESALRFFSLRSDSDAVPDSKELRGSTPDGLIDRQTLLYYFSRKPPSFSGGGIWLADHSRNAYYRYRVEGFEDFSLAGHGSLRTLKVVVFESAKGESIELWLAPDLRYLPVRVRHKDRAGRITEQLATSLSVE